MESYVQVLNYGIPFFTVLILIEWAASYYMGVQVNRPMDLISSISSGLTNIIKDVLGLTIIIVSYTWMVEHFALFQMESTALLYVLAWVGNFSHLDVLLGAGFIVLSIFSFTTLMDRNPWAVFTEFVKLVLGCSLIYRLDGWYNIDGWLSGGTWLIVAYFVLAFLATLYFTYVDRPHALAEHG